VREATILEAGLAKRIGFYRKNLDAAKGLISVGEAPTDKSLDPAELAAYMIAASTLMNLDECVTKE
jgi:hypothetical protein